MLDIIEKYSYHAYGYAMAFVGSVALWEKIALAALLGFAGAVGGWIFDVVRKKIEKYIEQKKESNGQS